MILNSSYRSWKHQASVLRVHPALKRISSSKSLPKQMLPQAAAADRLSSAQTPLLPRTSGCQNCLLIILLVGSCIVLIFLLIGNPQYSQLQQLFPCPPYCILVYDWFNVYPTRNLMTVRNLFALEFCSL